MKYIDNSKIAVFADLHLGVRQNSPIWHTIALNWVDWFAKELEKRQIETILFLGDFFHYRDEIAVNTLHVGYQLLKKLEKYKIVMIPGNHDSFYKETADINSIRMFNEWSNLTILNEVTHISIAGKDAYFVPWGGDLSLCKKADYLFGHFEINSFKMNSCKVCENGTPADEYLKIAPRVFSGHFHQRDVRTFIGGTITYVGNPFEMDFGDLGQTKGFYVLDTIQQTAEFVTNTVSPQHIKIYASTEGGVLPSSVKNNIIKVVVDQNIGHSRVEEITAKFNAAGPLYSSVEYKTPEFNSADKHSECDLTGVTLEAAIAEFITIMNPPNKDDVIATCLDVYHQFK